MAYQAHAFDSLPIFVNPMRHVIFMRLEVLGPTAVGVMARGMPISRPAVSQRLRVLKEAGLVTATAVGTKRIYRVKPGGIAAMRARLHS